jgi:tetrahydromethanopterin S-methyltransferase subunit A
MGKGINHETQETHEKGAEELVLNLTLNPNLNLLVCGGGEIKKKIMSKIKKETEIFV